MSAVAVLVSGFAALRKRRRNGAEHQCESQENAKNSFHTSPSVREPPGRRTHPLDVFSNFYNLIEDHSLISVAQNTVFQVPVDAARQHRTLQVPAFLHQILHLIAM